MIDMNDNFTVMTPLFFMVTRMGGEEEEVNNVPLCVICDIPIGDWLCCSRDRLVFYIWQYSHQLRVT